jgi:hypothetical protein
MLLATLILCVVTSSSQGLGIMPMHLSLNLHSIKKLHPTEYFMVPSFKWLL